MFIRNYCYYMRQIIMQWTYVYIAVPLGLCRFCACIFGKLNFDKNTNFFFSSLYVLRMTGRDQGVKVNIAT